MKSKTTIMLIEDDLVDVMNVKRALKELRVTNPIIVKSNGEEALVYLHDQNSRKPGIILLDLNMPRMSGLELLEIIKKDNKLKTIPVIVLTTSEADKDKLESFNLGVAGYIVKPISYVQFVEMMRTLHLYWTLSEVPE